MLALTTSKVPSTLGARASRETKSRLLMELFIKDLDKRLDENTVLFETLTEPGYRTLIF